MRHVAVPPWGGATKAHQAMDGNKGREGGPSPVEPGGDVGMHLANPPPLADERRKGQKQHLSAEGQPLPLKNGGRCGVLRFPRGMACKGLLGFWGGGSFFLSFFAFFFFFFFCNRPALSSDKALGFATRSLHQCCRAQYSHPM